MTATNIFYNFVGFRYIPPRNWLCISILNVIMFLTNLLCISILNVIMFFKELALHQYFKCNYVLRNLHCISILNVTMFLRNLLCISILNVIMFLCLM